MKATMPITMPAMAPGPRWEAGVWCLLPLFEAEEVVEGLELDAVFEGEGLVPVFEGEELVPVLVDFALLLLLSVLDLGWAVLAASGTSGEVVVSAAARSRGLRVWGRRVVVGVVEGSVTVSGSGSRGSSVFEVSWRARMEWESKSVAASADAGT